MRLTLVALLIAALCPHTAAISDENFYDILGVSQTATAAEIKSAYRKKSLELHPDKQEASSWADTTAEFIKVAEAYATLSNPTKRRAYNVRSGSSPFTFSMEDALAVLEEFIAEMPGLEDILPKIKQMEAHMKKHWKNYDVPLPQLLATGALMSAAAMDVDWEAVTATASDAISKQFVDDKGEVRWGRVAAAGAAAAAAIAAATAAPNSTSSFLGWAGSMLNAMGAGGQQQGKAPATTTKSELR